MKLNIAGYSRAVTTAFLLLNLFLIISCSTLTKVSSVMPDDWKSVVNQKNKKQSWEIRGRLGIRSEHDSGSLDLFWGQNEDDYVIRLIAPLGQGAFYIEGDAESVRIQSKNGLTQSSSDPGSLFKEQLGVDLPVSSLRYWLLGIPDSRLPVELSLWNEKGQLHRIVQAGWTIEMSRYESVDNIVLPHLFLLKRNHQPELIIRLLIRQWTF